MADFNDAIRQWLAQMQQQGSTGPGGVAGADLPSGPASYGSTGPGHMGNLPVRSNRETSTGPGYMGNLPVRSNRTMTTPMGYNPDLQSARQVQGTTPPSGGSMPSDVRELNQMIPHMQPQQQPFAPPSQAQDQGMAGAAGAQMPPGILQAMIQKLLGM